MKNVSLEYVVSEDAYDHFKIFSDVEITRTLIFPEGYPPDTPEQLMEIWKTEGYFNTDDVTKMNDILFAIKFDGHTVGYLYLSCIERENSTAELEITMCAAQHCGKGLGAQAITLAKEFAFSTLGLGSLYLYVLDSNARAIRCYEKCDFILDETKPHSRADVLRMQVTK